jgi:nicotinamide mononucleotide adenylyltransferase
MRNNVAVGFMAVGDISLNRSFVNSYMCSATERMIAACYSDLSLMRELGTLMGTHVNYRSLLEDESEYDGEDLPEDMLEPDRHAVAAQIKQLAELRDSIRGPMYNEAGDIRTFNEYKGFKNV